MQLETDSVQCSHTFLLAQLTFFSRKQGKSPAKFLSSTLFSIQSESTLEFYLQQPYLHTHFLTQLFITRIIALRVCTHTRTRVIEIFCVRFLYSAPPLVCTHSCIFISRRTFLLNLSRTGKCFRCFPSLSSSCFLQSGKETWTDKSSESKQ